MLLDFGQSSNMRMIDVLEPLRQEAGYIFSYLKGIECFWRALAPTALAGEGL